MGYNLAMVHIVIAVVLLIIALLALSLQRFYSAVPIRELKRLAAQGDHLAKNLYRVVSYGASVRLFLWIVFGAGLAGGLTLLSGLGQLWFMAVLFAVILALVWLWTARLTGTTAQLASWFSPVVTKVMIYLYRPLSFIAEHAGKLRIVDAHTGLYEKDDLISLLHQQQNQPDSRISQTQLHLIENSLKAHEWQAADLVTPWKMVKQVEAMDRIGPILLSELHESGQNVFVVYKDKPENVVGSLNLADAISAKEGGQIADIMRPNIVYVHEGFSMHQVFNAFGASGRSMVVVINSFGESLGVITLQDALSKLLGEAEDEPIVYEDRQTVAGWRPQVNPEPATVPVVDEMPPESSSEPTEVIE